jgi:hypothetical protein
MKKTLSFLISLSTFLISAQVKEYTLEECVMIALEKNISIQQSELDLEGARCNFLICKKVYTLIKKLKRPSTE